MVHYFDKKSKGVVEVHSAPRVIEGLQLIEQVCPINPLTGKRSSLIEALLSVSADPEKRHILGEVLNELPTLRSDPNLDDEGRMAVLAERLSTGTPAEDEAFAERLASLSDILFRGASHAVKQEFEEKVESVASSSNTSATEDSSVSE